MSASGNTFGGYTAFDYVTTNGLANTGYNQLVPTNGFNIVIPNNILDLILMPVSTLASGTIQLPATTQDGKLIEIVSSQLIVLLSLTCASGDTIAGGTTTLLATTRVAYKYLLPIKTWIKKQ